MGTIVMFIPANSQFTHHHNFFSSRYNKNYWQTTVNEDCSCCILCHNLYQSVCHTKICSHRFNLTAWSFMQATSFPMDAVLFTTSLALQLLAGTCTVIFRRLATPVCCLGNNLKMSIDCYADFDSQTKVND
ncbi:hypothetical protein GHT06_014691 [Daphnia sinensis]|uniref:Uncharacterized protein n=1 Tax=Daphnia sinensis TaxID=1820382 RepID=A0AAD5PVG1_9CRUS|nr:hypothetical protein GHT06_014691 [Daphnia sinensis]